ncbi:MAG: hypothetical protein CVV44_18630 [Spirochaetae bacterium HGW-Spirochaetae-1]|nr:MAG: hypothetical protein CVV44_18630 [Spirochaetae bacterium HGW-Spirochaetae-1]
MEVISKAQRARTAIRIFKTTADALALRGYYKPSGRSGQTLAESLKTLSPEIYGSINDARIIELKGLEYVMDRLPRGIEECTRIILTAEEDLEHTTFEKITPLKRRRGSYRVSEKEMSFVITSGISEIYDILTHITFLNIEAEKIRNQACPDKKNPVSQWQELTRDVREGISTEADLDRALWNLSIILGRTYHETRDTYRYMEKNRLEQGGNRGLFHIIHSLGTRAMEECESRDDMLLVYFTPALREMIGLHTHGKKWSETVKDALLRSGLHERPLHIISANMHSVMNALYAHGALGENRSGDFYEFIHEVRDSGRSIQAYAAEHGLQEIGDTSGAYIDCQIIDTYLLKDVPFHPAVDISKKKLLREKPVILVMDYAFGAQAFEIMEELLSPYEKGAAVIPRNLRSISVMGKAGILTGKKGDIMLATAHVFEGTPHNYIINNDLLKEDFDTSVDVYEGPIVTVLGTSLQNRDVLEKFQKTTWRAVGLEMEGGHYQRAISAALIRGHISPEVKVRYAYYASDNPLVSGQTLSSGGLGEEGIKPTYMITRVILEKIAAG